MSTPPSYFDVAAAEDAANQLLATAESVAEVASILVHDTAVVTEDWSGRFRDSFDGEIARVLLSAEHLTSMLQLQAAGIRGRAWQAEAAVRAAEEGE